VEVHGRPLSHRASSRTRLPGDNLEHLVAGLRAYESAGVDHIVLALNSGDMMQIRALMENIAQKVMPQFR
jgi:hypothetical protein